MSVLANGKGPKNRRYWPSPDELARQIPTSFKGSVCYELGVTGSIHAGSFRALHFAEQVQRAAAKEGKEVDFILRLNDLVPTKSEHVGIGSAHNQGYRIASEIRDEDGQTALEILQNDLQLIYARTGWKAPQPIKVSEIYRTDRFIALLESALQHPGEICETLSKFKHSAVSIHSPICPNCRRLRSARPIEVGPAQNDWECDFCDTRFEYSPGRSPGIVTFKLEQALMWQFCSTVVDVHGQDHVEAFDASSDLVGTLKLAFSPLAGRVNLVFNRTGDKLSKSRSNFTPISKMSTSDLHDLILKFDGTSYWRPIKVD